MNHLGSDGLSLWDDKDGFFYDVLHLPDHSRVPLRVRSMVGLIPLYAVRFIEPALLDRMPAFKRRMQWFIENRPDLIENMACMETEGIRERRLFSIVDGEQLKRILRVMLDENEFLSLYGVRAVSRYHLEHPYTLELDGVRHSVGYEPAESSTGLFGGNSNWRGPIWMPVNYLLIESLRRFHQYHGDEFKVECPTGSGQMRNLGEVADELSARLVNIFRSGSNGRPVHSRWPKFAQDPHWRELISFHEYFHGDSGAGVGASHQTGWTALVANLISEVAESTDRPATSVAVTASKES